MARGKDGSGRGRGGGSNTNSRGTGGGSWGSRGGNASRGFRGARGGRGVGRGVGGNEMRDFRFTPMDYNNLKEEMDFSEFVRKFDDVGTSQGELD
jgi:hypothetical protein